MICHLTEEKTACCTPRWQLWASRIFALSPEQSLYSIATAIQDAIWWNLMSPCTSPNMRWHDKILKYQCALNVKPNLCILLPGIIGLQTHVPKHERPKHELNRLSRLNSINQLVLLCFVHHCSFPFWRCVVLIYTVYTVHCYNPWSEALKIQVHESTLFVWWFDASLQKYVGYIVLQNHFKLKHPSIFI